MLQRGCGKVGFTERVWQSSREGYGKVGVTERVWQSRYYREGVAGGSGVNYS